MKKVYVAHPFGNKSYNMLKVEEIIKKRTVLYPDNLFISPIHALGFMYTAVSYVKGMDYCLELLSTCDELMLCKGWEDSVGCRMEYAFAKGRGIPIYEI